MSNEQPLQMQQILGHLHRFWSLQTASRTDKLLPKCSNAFGIFEQPLRLGPKLRAKEGRGPARGSGRLPSQQALLHMWALCAGPWPEVGPSHTSGLTEQLQ